MKKGNKMKEIKIEKVICIGRGNKGEGCGIVLGKSGDVCTECGGMILSSNRLCELKMRLESNDLVD